MNKTNTNPAAQSNRFLHFHSWSLGRIMTKLSAVVLLAGTAMLTTVPARAQSVTLLATNLNVFAGGNYSGIYTNNQLRAVTTSLGANAAILTVSGTPIGATILFSTNGYATTAASIGFSNRSEEHTSEL